MTTPTSGHLVVIGTLWAVGFAGVVVQPHSAPAQASPDRPAALVVYPYLFADTNSGADTLIELTNTSTELTDVQCFYENITPQCVGGQPGETCLPPAFACSSCVPQYARTPFHIRITPRQPLAWHLSTGLTTFPLDGTVNTGPEGASNAGSAIPALSGTPLAASLRCVVVNAAGEPIDSNALMGMATLERFSGGPQPVADMAQYKATGLSARPGAVNDDGLLVVGGPQAEYDGCASVTTLQHFFDGAVVHAGGSTATVATTLVLVPCSRDLNLEPRIQGPIVQMRVYNEFDQRFMTSRAVGPQLIIPLSMIETRVGTHSIFHAGVSGTLTGQTRLTAVNGGVLGLAVESHTLAPDHMQTDAYQLGDNGSRFEPDAMILKPPRCAGDCDGNGVVTIDEIITAVTIALETAPFERCRAADGNGDGAITVDEIIAAVLSALDGCPLPTPTPTPPATYRPTLTSTPTLGSVGPEITHLGLARADDVPLQPDTFDAEGRGLVYMRPFGQGMSIVIEARRGTSGRAIGGSTYEKTGASPDLQVLVSRSLGDGDPTVCEADGRRGGVPGVPTLDFAGPPSVIDAVNDLGCRAANRSPGPAGSSAACTRLRAPSPISPGPFAFVNVISEAQFCIPIARAWAFPIGDTIVAARLRDDGGTFGAVREMVVRVQGQ